MYHYEYLNNAPFLQQLTESNLKELYAKITVLDWNEHIIKEITGRTIGGSINLDGTSAMRRSATLQLIADDKINDLTNIDNLISLNKKVELQIGLKNLTKKYQEYPIFWFPQGIFIIVGASIEHGLDGVKINITLHDKIALLNGECGGTLPAPITFSEMDDEDNFGNILTTNPRISSIIRELVHHWGKEAEKNIIIKDLDSSARQVLRWCGQDEKPLHYFFINEEDVATKKLSQKIYDKLIQLNSSMNPTMEEEEFYEQLMKNLIKISFENNKYYNAHKEYFPQPEKVVQYFTENATSKQIKDLQIIVEELNNVYKNSETLLNNLEEERNTLQSIKNQIDEQITVPMEDFKSKVIEFQSFLKDFYEKMWKNAYKEGFYYSNGVDEKKEKRSAIKTDKIDLLKPQYQNKESINKLKTILKQLQTKVKIAQQSLGKNYKTWEEWRNNDFIKYGNEKFSFKIVNYNILTWLFWSGAPISSSSLKWRKNAKNTNITQAKKLWENNSNYFFDAPKKNTSVFIRRRLEAGVDKNKKAQEYGYLDYGIVKYNNNNNQEFIFSIPLYLKYYDTNGKEIKINGYNSAYLAVGSSVNQLIFQEYLQSLKEKGYSKENLRKEIEDFIYYRPFEQLMKCCEYYKNTSDFKSTVASYLMKSFNKNYYPTGITDENTKEVFTAFLNLIAFLINEVQNIEEQYNYNIKTLEYMKKRALSDKIYKTVNSQENNQTFFEKAKEKIQQLKQLAEKLPIDFKQKMTVPGFFVWKPAYKDKNEVKTYTRWHITNSVSNVTNLRDIGKYMVDNTGIFSDLNSDLPLKINKNDKKPEVKKVRIWIKQNHQFSISSLISRMETLLKNYDFSQHNFNQIFTDITKLIYKENYNSHIAFEPLKPNNYWSAYIFIQRFYLTEFLNKLTENQAIKNERKKLKSQSEEITKRLDQIEKNELAISKGCNQITKKWFQNQLKSYEELIANLKEKTSVETRLEKLKQQEKQIKDYLNNTSQSTKIISKNLAKISSSSGLQDLIKSSLILNPNAKNAIEDPLIKATIKNANSRKEYVNQMQTLQNAVLKQKNLLKDFQTNLEENPIIQPSLQEKEVQRAEAELIRLQKEINISKSTKDTVQELNNIIKARQQDLQSLLNTFKKEKIKLFKNFFTNLQDKHKDLFFSAFGKSAFYKDLYKSKRRWGQDNYKYMPTKVKDLTEDHLYIIYNSLFDDPAIKISNTWKQNPTNRMEFFNTFYKDYCIPAYKYGKKQYKYGEDIGYTFTDFTYPGELSCNAGETITSILDKIKNTLGNYEYFYDVNGNFVFQEIPNYLNNSYSTSLFQEIVSNKNFSFKYNMLTPITYDLSNGKIIQSYQNTPQYQQIKNDFLVWGEKQTATGQKLPIKYHLSIDVEPSTGMYYFLDAPKENVKKYRSKTDLPLTSNEICYVEQQNTCYEYIDSNGFVGYKKVDFIINSKKGCGNFPTGIGSISKYYFNEDTQLLYTWNKQKQKYEIAHTYLLKICAGLKPSSAQGVPGYYYYDKQKNIYVCTENRQLKNITEQVHPLQYASNPNSILYLQGYQAETMGIESNDYYAELKNEWPKMWSLIDNSMYKNVEKEFTSINYFLHLLNSNPLIDKFNVSTIGRRTHVISNSAINCIFEPVCPNIVFFDNNPPLLKNLTFSQQSLQRLDYEQKTKPQKLEDLRKYNRDHASNYIGKFVDHSIYQYFKLGGLLRSAYEEIRSELYQFITYNEQISINILPMYYLEPNQIIKIQDDKTGINGAFLVKSFSIPLDINSTMSLTCTKVISKI